MLRGRKKQKDGDRGEWIMVRVWVLVVLILLKDLDAIILLYYCDLARELEAKGLVSPDTFMAHLSLGNRLCNSDG